MVSEIQIPLNRIISSRNVSEYKGRLARVERCYITFEKSYIIHTCENN
jgi:hypothetical protein